MILLIWSSIAVIIPVLCRDVAMFGPFGAHRGHGFPLPPLPVPLFLVNSTDQVKIKYFETIANKKLTIDNIKTELEHLSAENNILDGYHQWEEQQTRMRHWRSDEVAKILARLSDVKIEVDQVMGDSQQTTQLQEKRLLDLTQKYSREVAVLNFIINQVLTSAPRQGQFTAFSGQKRFGEFEKVAIDGDKLPK